MLVATAGGIRGPVVNSALNAEADMVVVGREVPPSKNVRFAAEEFLEELEKEGLQNLCDFKISRISLNLSSVRQPKKRLIKFTKAATEIPKTAIFTVSKLGS